MALASCALVIVAARGSLPRPDRAEPSTTLSSMGGWDFQRTRQTSAHGVQARFGPRAELEEIMFHIK